MLPGMGFWSTLLGTDRSWSESTRVPSARVPLVGAGMPSPVDPDALRAAARTRAKVPPALTRLAAEERVDAAEAAEREAQREALRQKRVDEIRSSPEAVEFRRARRAHPKAEKALAGFESELAKPFPIKLSGVGRGHPKDPQFKIHSSFKTDPGFVMVGARSPAVALSLYLKAIDSPRFADKARREGVSVPAGDGLRPEGWSAVRVVVCPSGEAAKRWKRAEVVAEYSEDGRLRCGRASEPAARNLAVEATARLDDLRKGESAAAKVPRLVDFASKTHDLRRARSALVKRFGDEAAVVLGRSARSSDRGSTSKRRRETAEDRAAARAESEARLKDQADRRRAARRGGGSRKLDIPVRGQGYSAGGRSQGPGHGWRSVEGDEYIGGR